jgi:anti-anti-sigma factor
MKYAIENNDNIVIFTLKNEALNSRISADFKAELLILCQPSIDALILDISTVQSIDSAGLGGVLLAYRQLHEHGVPIILVGVQEMVKMIMDISQIGNQFVFCDTLEEATNYAKDLEE